MTYSQFSPEVITERAIIEVYGLRGSGKPSSFKQQAAHELARRLILEQEIEDLRREMNARRNELEAARGESVTF